MKYFSDASSINFRRSVIYGLGVLRTSLEFRLSRWHLGHSKHFSKAGRSLAWRDSAGAES